MIRIISLIAILTYSTLYADPKLLIWGDSLSASYGIEEHLGWVSLLQERIDSQNLQVEVINGIQYNLNHLCSGLVVSHSSK